MTSQRLLKERVRELAKKQNLTYCQARDRNRRKPRTIALLSRWGGAGRTATASALAHFAARQGKHVAILTEEPEVVSFFLENWSGRSALNPTVEAMPQEWHSEAGIRVRAPVDGRDVARSIARLKTSHDLVVADFSRDAELGELLIEQIDHVLLPMPSGRLQPGAHFYSHTRQLLATVGRRTIAFGIDILSDQSLAAFEAQYAPRYAFAEALVPPLPTCVRIRSRLQLL